MSRQNLPAHPTVGLEVQFQTELELARVEGGGRAAEVVAAAVALREGVNVCEEGGRGGLVEAVEEVEALGDDVEVEALAEANLARQPKVERGVAVCDAEVAAQAPRCELAVRDERRAARGSGNAESAVGEHRRSVGLVRLVVVRVHAGQDVEGAARGNLKDGRDDEVGEEAVH